LTSTLWPVAGTYFGWYFTGVSGLAPNAFSAACTTNIFALTAITDSCSFVPLRQASISSTPSRRQTSPSSTTCLFLTSSQTSYSGTSRVSVADGFRGFRISSPSASLRSAAAAEVPADLAAGELLGSAAKELGTSPNKADTSTPSKQKCVIMG